MRTNIVIDDRLMSEAMKASGFIRRLSVSRRKERSIHIEPRAPRARKRYRGFLMSGLGGDATSTPPRARQHPAAH